MRDTPFPVTGVLLAGGRGSRMGGEDKGLIPLAGKPMAETVLARLAPQVHDIIISANRHAADYAALGHPVVADRIEGLPGPLAGLHAAMRSTVDEWIVSVPCDTPFLPFDLVARLIGALHHAPAPLAVAAAAGRTHPVFCLCRTTLADDLETYLTAGGRKVSEWQCRHRAVVVDFSHPDAFANINTPEERLAAEQKMTASPPCHTPR